MTKYKHKKLKDLKTTLIETKYTIQCQISKFSLIGV